MATVYDEWTFYNGIYGGSHLHNPINRMGAYRDTTGNTTERRYATGGMATVEDSGDFYTRVLMLTVGTLAVAKTLRLFTNLAPAVVGSGLMAVALAPNVTLRTAQMALGFGVGVAVVGDQSPTDQVMGGALGMLLLSAPDVVAQLV